MTGDERSNDRRAATRHFACYPIHIERAEGGHEHGVEIAVIEDLSASGALLRAREEVAIGARVRLHLDVFGDPSRVRVVEGHAVRAEPRPEDRAEVWPFAIAVEFDAAVPELEPMIEALERAAPPRSRE